MPDRHVAHLIVGGGIAAATCAETLRAEGAPGDVLVVGRELDPPYHRPPCSKGYLQGAEDRASALVHPESFYADNAIELLTRTSVMALDTDARTATLSTKEVVGYDRALIATGAMVRRLGVDGSGLDGLHYLRALGNADAIRADVEGVDEVVLIGGSYIGCEVAASLTVLGKRCTVVMQEEEPLSRGFGLAAGRRLRGVLESHGITVLGGRDVEAFEGPEGGRVTGVRLAGGEVLAAGAVVLGVGAMPDVMLARKSGLTLGEAGGVLCSSSLQTSAAGVYAAGDICEYDSVVHGRVLRIEHEDVAQQQGAFAARAMLGADGPYDVVPYFFSDLADWASLEYIGPAASWTREEASEDGGFTLYYDGDRVVAALSLDGAGDLDAARETIYSSSPSA